ncbi:acyclic terpene utilization AtuA family protein [Altererythrobacter aerius]|uniref:Acyclic terpene utilization AtuA family protein n=1 Tax=Tsuneonella aeria TaxID=1837929 RepID=A0A6I4TCJ9_9SPHN|nr:acyclic terpene utilization AtuA family protein [Tsuneonella aeria]MXO74326.1 acyclic terpene utilization AtuA family protein [Tsuneonella aeria]
MTSAEQSAGRVVRIGGGAAFFIDSALAVPQLLADGVDYIVLDYLAEGAMGLLGRMRAADPGSGYPSDFMQVHIGPHLETIAKTGCRIVANAGGVNPAALVAALRAEIARRGLALKVACISGDDLLHRLPELAGTPDMANGELLPGEGVTSCNAYLGAFPIAEALLRGADIVVTGRVVDSALTLGALVHEFGWAANEWEKLAAGTLAGHLVECGAQATGGTFTDWESVEGWDTIGAPIAECRADGTFVLTKPAGSGGVVNCGTVAEQMLYETADPQAYIVPDVVLDMSEVRLAQIGPDRVAVTGAIGHPSTGTLKVCATWDKGWRGTALQPVIGPRAVARARKQADALFARGAAMLRARNMAPFLSTEAVLVGAGEAIGLLNEDAQEVLVKLVVDHDEAAAVQGFVREQFAAISAMAPGTSVAFGVSVAPLMRLVSFLIPKADVVPLLDVDAGFEPLAATADGGFDAAAIQRPAPPAPGALMVRELPLERLAWARSGEKGETVNIGVIARDPARMGDLRAALTPQAVRAWFAHLFVRDAGAVRIYDLPGIAAVNIVLEGALPGGINASTRLDPAAKSVAQQLMRFPVPVSA